MRFLSCGSVENQFLLIFIACICGGLPIADLGFGPWIWTGSASKNLLLLLQTKQNTLSSFCAAQCPQRLLSPIVTKPCTPGSLAICCVFCVFGGLCPREEMWRSRHCPHQQLVLLTRWENRLYRCSFQSWVPTESISTELSSNRPLLPRPVFPTESKVRRFGLAFIPLCLCTCWVRAWDVCVRLI